MTMIISKGVVILRLSAKERYKTNPFRNAVIAHTVSGQKTIYASPTIEDSFAMVSRTTGEDFGDIAFGKRVKVDKTDFLKLYANGVRMFLGLKSAGIKVFMIIYDILLTNDGYQADSVDLVYEALSDEVQRDISRATFFRGIRELVNVNFLAPAIQAGKYWINADYVFRGNRLTLVNEYIMEPVEPPKEVKKIKHIPTEILKSARSRVATA